MAQQISQGTSAQSQTASKLLESITPRTFTLSSSQRRFIVGIAGMLTAALIIFRMTTPSKSAENWADALSVATAAVALLFSYWQWHKDKRSASFDSYYSRLELANQKFSAAELVSLQSSEPGRAADHHYTMFVFAELDNLEYAIAKFRLHLLDSDTAVRAITHIMRRCVNPKFRALARWCVDKGAYDCRTRSIVFEVCQIAEGDNPVLPQQVRGN